MILGNNNYQLIKHLVEKDMQASVIIKSPIGYIFYSTNTEGAANVNMLLKKDIL